MFKVVYVKLKNFRSHSDFLFEPRLEGITAIKGATGSGKSSIVDGLTWCLYGTKPNGVSKASQMIRKGVEVGKEEKSYVEACLKIYDKDVKIQRRIVNKKGAVECDVWFKNEDDEWSHVSGSAVSFSDKFIKELIRLDERGFLTTIHVQQKQVDDFISSKDRGKVIEDLVGISSITNALISSRAESNALKKFVKTNTPDPAKIKEFSKILKEKDTLLKKSETKLKTLAKKKEQLVSKSLSDKEEYDKSLEIFKLNRNYNTTLESLKIREEALKESLDSKFSTLTNLKKELGGKMISEEYYEELGKKIKKEESALAVSEERIRALSNELSDLNGEEQSLRKALSNAPFKNLEESKEYLKKAKEKHKEISDEINETARSIGEKKGVINSLKKAIKTFQSSGATCPTCLQTVNSADEAINSLKSTGATVSLSLTKLENKMKELQEMLKKAEASAKKTEKIIPLLEKDLESKITEVKKEIQNLLVSEDKSKKSLSRMSQKFKEMSEMYSKMQEIKILNTDALNTHEALKEVRFKIDELNRSKPESNVSEFKLETLRKKYDNNSEKASLAKDSYQEANLEYNRLLQDRDFTKKELDALNKEMEEYSEQINRVEIAVKSNELIEKFREDVIKESVPAIEGFASSLVSKFTGGKFQGIRIDQKFNLSVLMPDGELRPVGLLSGGELSASALALRLGIAQFFNSSGRDNAIILDEVLVSQDSDRAELILNSIKESFDGQVIIIAHNDIVTSISDEVVSL